MLRFSHSRASTGRDHYDRSTYTDTETAGLMYWINRKKLIRRTFLLIAGTSALLAQAPRPDVAGAEFFEKKIRPVFATRCFVCHSASAPKIQGGLHLDTRDLLRKG